MYVYLRRWDGLSRTDAVPHVHPAGRLFTTSVFISWIRSSISPPSPSAVPDQHRRTGSPALGPTAHLHDRSASHRQSQLRAQPPVSHTPRYTPHRERRHGNLDEGKNLLIFAHPRAGPGYPKPCRHLLVKPGSDLSGEAPRDSSFLPHVAQLTKKERGQRKQQFHRRRFPPSLIYSPSCSPRCFYSWKALVTGAGPRKLRQRLPGKATLRMATSVAGQDRV